MASSAITTSIRYLSDGKSAAWPIPFPFASDADVAVKVMNAEGMERRLTLGKDYLISNGCVVVVVPAGHSLVIWLDAPVDAAVQNVAARAMAADTENRKPVSDTFGRMAVSGTALTSETSDMSGLLAQLSAQVEELKWEQENALLKARQAEADTQVQRLSAEGESLSQRLDAEAAARVAEATTAIESTARELLKELAENGRSVSDAVARAEARVRDAERSAEAAQEAVIRLRKEVAELTDTATRRVATASAEADSAVKSAASTATAQVRQASEAATRRIGVLSTLESSAMNADGWWEQTATLRKGDILTLPAGLVYYPGRSMLRITYQNTVLARGRHYEEIGEIGTLSDSIRVLFDSRAGDEWSFWVVASNASASAEEAAKRAEAAKADAQQAAWRAGQDAGAANAARAKAETAADHAGRWLNAVESSADDAYRLAVCAWNAAYQSSMASAKPGISAVKDRAELAHCVSGLYIVNPHLTHSPTLFMGVWPVAEVEDMTWDGVFFIGPPYPDNPTPPPAPCDRPDRPKPDIPGGPNGGDEGNGGNNLQWKPCGRA